MKDLRDIKNVGEQIFAAMPSWPRSKSTWNECGMLFRDDNFHSAVERYSQDNFTFELSLTDDVVQSLKTSQIFLPFCRPFAHDRLSKAIFHSVVTRLKLKTFYPRRLTNRSISEKL